MQDDDRVMYNIVRFYEDEQRDRRVIATVYGLKEARKWCNDPETSSYTAKPPRGCGGNKEKIEKWHKQNKHWFEGYERV